MLFCIIGVDKPNSLDLRMATREAHLAFWGGTDAVRVGGPFVDSDDKPNGSMIVIEADDLDAATALADQDPYIEAGLYASRDIRPWKWLLKE